MIGDPSAGWDTLRYGSFVGSGIPADVWFDLPAREAPRNLLERDGRSADLERSFNLFAAPNGVEVVGGITCLGCHSGEVEGTFVPGLGDARADFSSDFAASLFPLVEALVGSTYGDDSPEAEALAPFVRGGTAVAEATVTPFAGVNPAFDLELAAAAHRDPETLEWLDEPAFTTDTKRWSDTPPLWHAKRRESLYWTGFARGERRRLVLQISVVGITDATQVDALLPEFDDVVAWLETLEAPAYPGAVDEALASDGEQLFGELCSGCHGSCGERASYPEVVVPLDEIGTDPVYAQLFGDTPFVAWLAESWFSSDGGIVPTDDGIGYVAPPLDGIWATAPYFHNGSVPDLASVLDPSRRPARWRRDPVDTSIDHDTMGWPWTDGPADEWLYDTAVEGAGNAGHTYGAARTNAERAALLEYLKTL